MPLPDRPDPNEPKRTSHIEVELKKATGSELINLNPGTRTLLLDMDRISKGVIAEFVQAVVEEFPSKKRNLQVEDLVGLAIGHFEVPLSDLFNGKVEELTALDDRSLAQVFRFRERKKKS